MAFVSVFTHACSAIWPARNGHQSKNPPDAVVSQRKEGISASSLTHRGAVRSCFIGSTARSKAESGGMLARMRALLLTIRAVLEGDGRWRAVPSSVAAVQRSTSRRFTCPLPGIFRDLDFPVFGGVLI